MAKYVNTDNQTRRWTFLVDTDTDRTLELAPGESADVGIWVQPVDNEGHPTGGPATVQPLPADFEDEYLQLATTVRATKAAAASAPSKGATPEPAEASATAEPTKE